MSTHALCSSPRVAGALLGDARQRAVGLSNDHAPWAGVHRRRVLVGGALLLVMGTAAQAFAQNLLANPDFECCPPSYANFGFMTEYIEWPASDRGAFSVRSDPQNWNGFFPACADHTPTGTRMMCVDGDTHLAVWAQTLSGLQIGKTYRFRFWWLNLYPDNPAVLRVRFRPEPGENWQYTTEAPWVYLTLPADCQWQQAEALWYSGGFTTMTIVLDNVQSGETGVDFALDDMEFTLPECWAAPQITSSPPAVRHRRVGVPITFSVDFLANANADLDDPLPPGYSLEWRRNGIPLGAGTLTDLGGGSYTTTLTIPAARRQDAGNYTFTISTPCGSDTSDPARLYVWFP